MITYSHAMTATPPTLTFRLLTCATCDAQRAKEILVVSFRATTLRPVSVEAIEVNSSSLPPRADMCSKCRGWTTIFLPNDSRGRSPVIDTPSICGNCKRKRLQRRGNCTALISMLHLPPWYTPEGCYKKHQAKYPKIHTFKRK